MEEKKISKVEFDEAVKQAIHEQVNDPDIEGMTAIIPVISQTGGGRVQPYCQGTIKTRRW